VFANKTKATIIVFAAKHNKLNTEYDKKGVGHEVKTAKHQVIELQQKIEP